MAGYLYLLSNAGMPGLLKIGFTRGSLTRRVRELETTGVPDGFVIVASFAVGDPGACEKAVHKRLAEFRLTDRREFFRMSPGEALTKISDLVSAHLSDSSTGASAHRSPALDALDESILQFIMHTQSGDTWPEGVVREFGIHREEACLRLGQLAEKGYLQERRERYWLAHKGRKYAFDRNLVIHEILRELRYSR